MNLDKSRYLSLITLNHQVGRINAVKELLSSLINLFIRQYPRQSSETKSDSNVCRPCQQNFWRLSTNICFLVQQIFVAAYGAGTGYLLVSSPNLMSPTGFIHKADKKASSSK